MITIQLSVGEVTQILDALAYRAKRHEAEGRARPAGAGPHDRAARDMWTLRERILAKTMWCRHDCSAQVQS